MGGWAIAVHGGAGVDPNLPLERQEEAKQLLTRVLNLGISALRSNLSAIDVVELVVRELETDPLFNSGRGSALTEKGTVEMEASIMDGPKRRCGAVSGLTTVKNPVSLARLVMEKSPHSYLAFDGAENFARQQGVEVVDNEYFITPDNVGMLKLAKEANTILFDYRIPTSGYASSSSSVELFSENDRLPAELKVSETPESNSRVRLHVEVPPIVCKDCYERVLVEFTKQAKISGFRPGKPVPESILLSYVGIKNVQKAVIESILRRTLSHAVTTVTGRALQDSVRIVTKFSEMEGTYSSHGLLRYEVIVDVAPEIKWISDDAYKNLKVVVEIDNEIDAHIASEKEFRRRYKSAGVLKVVTDRGLQIGDVVVLDISATTIDQDESNIKSIPSAESKGFNFDTDDSEILVPGFLDSIIGISRGETKSFPIVFPETWKQENLCGVHAQFTVECKELFYRDLPELDDSIADKLIPGCTTVEEVKELLLQRFQEIEQTAREQATDNAILDHISKMVEVDIPRSLFEEQGRQLYGSSLLEMQTKIKLNEQQLATLSSPKAVNEYLEHHRENIKNLIKQNLAVGDIYRRENLQLATEDIVKEVENSIAEFKRQQQEYDEERVKEQVQEILEGAKVLEWLKERAEIQYITR